MGYVSPFEFLSLHLYIPIHFLPPTPLSLPSPFSKAKSILKALQNQLSFSHQPFTLKTTTSSLPRSPSQMGSCFSRPLTGDEPCEWRCAYHYGCAHPIALAAQNGPETPYAWRLLKENDPYTRIYKARVYGEIPHDWAHDLAPTVAAGGVVTLPNGVRVGRDGVVGGGAGQGGGNGGG